MIDRDSPPTRDPLELARTQLDFAALAAGAPAVKEVLYKAQTMAPVAPPQFWKKAAKGAAAIAAVAFLLFTPFIPHNISYALLRVEFERPFAPVRAQQMVDATVRALPSDVLVGVEQRQSQGSQAVAPRVVLRLSQAGVSGSRLRRVAEDALVVVAREAQPLYYPADEYKQVSRHSLVQAVAGWLTPNTMPRYNFGGMYGVQANRLLKLEPLLQDELSARLAADGRQLSAFRFVSTGDVVPAGFDFVAPCWPLPAAVAIEGYASELDHEQEMIQLKTFEFLRSFNLMPELASGTDPSAQWPAIVVVVQDTSRRLNPQLSTRVQAAICQPSLRQASDIAYDPCPAVEQAVLSVVSWADCTTQISHTVRVDGSAGWRVAVVIEGERGHTLRVFENQETSEISSELF